MISKTISIKMDGSLEDSGVTAFLYTESKEIAVEKRPLVIVCPGGAYAWLSAREGETIAFQFLSMGYDAAVMKYSVAPAVYPASLLELATAVKYFKDNADELGIDPDKIVIFGASAGGHLVASFGVSYYIPEVTGPLKVSEDYLKPAGLILAYPVITSGEFAHRGSFDNLLGDDRKNDKKWLEYLSLENRVTDKTPQCFVWHTFTDGSVPLENSLLFVNALRRANVPFEYHVFPTGGHGLALANELTLSPSKKELNDGAEQWTGLCHTWLKNLFGPLVK